MIITVKEFHDRVERGLDGLVGDLQEATGRRTPQEEQAWRSSLPSLGAMLAHPSLRPLHLYFEGRGRMALEYPLPSAASWCDAVLLGRRADRRSAVIIELKDWSTASDRPGVVPGLIERHGSASLHPSEQVRGYVEYCQRFHSTVQDFDADVSGCAFFTAEPPTPAYLAAPNDGLVSRFPLFSRHGSDLAERIPRFLSSRLDAPDDAFALNWEHGYYRQERSFVNALAKQVADPAQSPFVLLDSQRLAFAKCRAAIEHALFRSTTLQKTVLVISGPPGSGKSVVAACLWAWLVLEPRLRAGNVVVTTTSASQRSNWEHAFSRLHSAAGGVVVPANSYAPVTTQELSKAMKARPDHGWAATDWTANLEILRSWRRQERVPSDRYRVSIVDEAHALINPEDPKARTPAGWPVLCGPQAYHIIRSSTVSIFLLDSAQGFRDRENTTVTDLSLWAAGLGATVGDLISLAESQYRCAGSKEYVDWLDAEFGLGSAAKPPVRRWRRRSSGPGQPQVPEDGGAIAAEPDRVSRAPFVFELVDSPFDLERVLRAHLTEGCSARLLASYSTEWRTKNSPSPHTLPPDRMDFHYSFASPEGPRTWSRVWNHVPPHDPGNYTWFVQAAPGSPMSRDPLCEVGCPYAVRGFDYDYIGVIWGNDLVWRTDRWVVQPGHVHETGISLTTGAARKASAGSAARETLRTKVMQAYRILLTRAIRGVYVWCSDEETRAHLATELGR